MPVWPLVQALGGVLAISAPPANGLQTCTHMPSVLLLTFGVFGAGVSHHDDTLAQDDKDGEVRWTSSLTGQSYSIPLLRSSADEE